VASAAGRQAALVAENIKKLIAAGSAADGGLELGRYEAAPAGIVVPIGPEGGSGQRPGAEDLLPPVMVAELKGRDMMVARFAEMLGVPAADEGAPPEG
jgi:hypothetical protein